MRTKIKIKGQQLREMQDKIAVVGFAIEKALTDCFLRQEVFELLDAARDESHELARLLGA